MLLALIWYSSHLQGKEFPVTRNESYFQMHISTVGYQTVQSCTCKEYRKTYNSWLLLYITIQPLTPIVNLKGTYSLTTSHLAIIKRHLQITSQIDTGLTL